MDVTINLFGKDTAFHNVRTYRDIAEALHPKLPYLLAFINDKTRDLNTPVAEGDRVNFVDFSHEEGRRAYIRSLSFLLVRAVKELFPGGDVLIDHTVGDGLYCKLENVGFVSNQDYRNIEKRMREIVARDEPFVRDIISTQQAREYFEEIGQFTTARLLIYKQKDTCVTYKCGAFRDAFHGALLPSTSYVDSFSIQYMLPGMIVYFPTCRNGELNLEQNGYYKYAAAFSESERWAKNLNCSYIPDLNDVTSGNKLRETIIINEVQHERKIGNIADMICSDENRQLVLIAGPSSSGKTTFANRLYTHLRANGKRPITISLDNYYKNRDEIGYDEFGEKDFENIDSLDVELFCEDLNRMLQQEAVELPTFNFLTGKREYSGNKTKVSKGQPIIVEGIHALNPRMSESISNSYKFRIYISPLAPINYDIHNRVPTRDIRLLRRIVRDHFYRGFSAEQTLHMWPAVLRGERKYIFPYQENADFVFNSSLVYEMPVLKRYAYPLLSALEEKEETYEVKRLLRLLNYVTEVEEQEERHIPPTSILREFIGGSSF